MAGRRRWIDREHQEEKVELPPGPRQKTDKGTEIPIPSRAEFLRGLERASKPTEETGTKDRGT